MGVDSFAELVAELTALAARRDDTGLRTILARLTRPLRIDVTGRPGVGRRTVGAALRAAGLDIAAGGPADVRVLVVAETVKPEDRRICADHATPLVTVLNKADLLADPRASAAAIEALTAVPTVPMSALPAIARLDDVLIAALRVLGADPADLSSTDAFCAGTHVVDAATRRRLLVTLDRTAIEALTTAVGRDLEPQTVLRALSNIDAVLVAVAAAAAPIRYRRLQTARTELHALAARTGDGELATLLAGDTAVLAAMRAASEVVRAAGLPDRGTPLQRARHWQHYSRGPVNALHRGCGADIARGALRLAARAGQLP